MNDINNAPPSLTRKDFDDPSRRNTSKNSFRAREFNSKRSAKDAYTGKRVYLSKNGPNASSGQQRYHPTTTTAQIDHIVPIDTINHRYKKPIESGSVSVEQVRKAANSDSNLAVTSEFLNKSKGKTSNTKYVINNLHDKNSAVDLKTATKMISKDVKANASVEVQVKRAQVSNKIKAVGEGTQAVIKNADQSAQVGASAALITLITSGITNLTYIASGKKSIAEAALDVAKDSGGTFIAAGALDLTQKALSEIAARSANENVAKILAKDLPVAEAAMLYMVASSAIKFINDDITAEECVTEILMNAAGTLAFQAGMAFGGPIGAVLASLVVGQISKSILEYKQLQKVSEQKARQINSLVRDALIEMENQRNILKTAMEAEFAMWDKSFNDGYEQIMKSALTNDTTAMANGIDLILSVFNQNCKFHTIEEFNDFFDDDNAVLVL